MQPIPTRIFAVTSALLLFVAAPARGQGFAVTTPDSSARITFGGRAQAVFNTTSVDDEPGTQMELRRVRLEANLQLGRVVSGRIQPDFAGNRVVLKDVYVRFALDPALQILAGQAHRPFGVISPYSTVRLLPIEKGVRIRGVEDAYDHFNLLSELGYSDRDVGLQLRGEPRNAPLGLSYAAGWFNGPARGDAPRSNSGQLVARVSAAPVGGVRIGASWSRRDFIEVDDDDVELDRESGWTAERWREAFAPYFEVHDRIGFGLAPGGQLQLESCGEGHIHHDGNHGREKAGGNPLAAARGPVRCGFALRRRTTGHGRLRPTCAGQRQ